MVDPVLEALVAALEAVFDSPEDRTVEEDAVLVRDVLSEHGVVLEAHD